MSNRIKIDHTLTAEENFNALLIDKSLTPEKFPVGSYTLTVPQNYVSTTGRENTEIDVTSTLEDVVGTETFYYNRPNLQGLGINRDGAYYIPRKLLVPALGFGNAAILARFGAEYQVVASELEIAASQGDVPFTHVLKAIPGSLLYIGTIGINVKMDIPLVANHMAQGWKWVEPDGGEEVKGFLYFDALEAEEAAVQRLVRATLLNKGLDEGQVSGISDVDVTGSNASTRTGEIIYDNDGSLERHSVTWTVQNINQIDNDLAVSVTNEASMTKAKVIEAIEYQMAAHYNINKASYIIDDFTPIAQNAQPFSVIVRAAPNSNLITGSVSFRAAFSMVL